MNGVNQDTLNRKRFQIELVHLYLFQQQIHRTLVVWVLAVWLHGWTGGGERGISCCVSVSVSERSKLEGEKKRSTKRFLPPIPSEVKTVNGQLTSWYPQCK